MKIFLAAAAFSAALSSAVYPDISLELGANAGMAASYYRDAGDSFGVKARYGPGGDYFLRLVLLRYIGIQLGIGGFYDVSESDSLGGYIYPERVEMPLSLEISGILPITLAGGLELRMVASAGGALPYRITASYFAPRGYVPGLLAGAACLFCWKDYKLSLGPALRFEYCFNGAAPLDCTLYYQVCLTYGLF